MASSPKFGDFAKNPNHDFALVPEHGRVRLVDVVLGQLSVFLNSFGVNGEYLLNFGRGPSQNPQKLTLAALKFGGGNVKNRRFQLGLVRFLPGFYRNTHREPLNTTTKGFGLEPRRSIQVVSGLKSVSRRYQPVGHLSGGTRGCHERSSSDSVARRDCWYVHATGEVCQ